MNKTKPKQMTKPIKLKENIIKEMTFDEVYQYYSNYIKKLAKHYSYIKADREDLFQEGSISLYKAYSTYNVEKNVLFKTYATKCIRNDMSKYNQKYIQKQTHNHKDVLLDTFAERNNLYKDIEDVDVNDYLIDKHDDYNTLESEILVDQYINSYESNNPKRDRNIIRKTLMGYSCGELGKELNLTRALVSYVNMRFKNKMKIELV